MGKIPVTALIRRQRETHLREAVKQRWLRFKFYVLQRINGLAGSIKSYYHERILEYLFIVK